MNGIMKAIKISIALVVFWFLVVPFFYAGFTVITQFATEVSEVGWDKAGEQLEQRVHERDLQRQRRNQ